MSPIGFHIKPEGFTWDNMVFKNGRRPPYFVRKLGKTAWTKKWSPFAVGRLFGVKRMRRSIRGYMNKH